MSGARAAFAVARREFLERARSKAFIISNVVILLAIIGGMAIPLIMGTDDTAHRLGYLDEGQAVAEIAAGLAPQFGTELETEAVTDAPAAQRLDPDEQAEADLLNAVAISQDTVLVHESLPDDLEQLLVAATQAASLEVALADADLSDEQREALLARPELTVDAVSPPEEVTEGPALAVAALAVFLLYGLLLFYGNYVAQGVVEEKASRVIEVLLSAVSPTALLYGKILGLTALGVFQTLLLATVGMGAATVMLDVAVPPEAYATLALAVAWFLLGFVMYATVFAASASLVSRQEDLQATVWPAMIPIIGGFFVAQATLQDPDSTVSLVASLVPFTAPLVQPLRYGAQVISPWEVPVAIALCVATIATLVPLAARLYAGSALRFGGRIKVTEAWKGATR